MVLALLADDPQMVPIGLVTTILQWLKDYGLLGAAVFILYASFKGYWVWGRDYKKLEYDRDEWKALSLKLGGIAEQATTVHLQQAKMRETM